MLGAKSIAFAREGASGVAFAALIERLGMTDTLMTAAVSSGAKQGAAARDLLKFLTAPAALPTIKAKGMERN